MVSDGAVAPLLINNASKDPRFSSHPALLIHGIESYIAVPLHRTDGSYFGTLCAFDPQPANLSEDDFAIFQLLSQLISFELEAEETRQQQEAQMRSLEDFISIAAHDLRQPLTVLYGNVQLLVRSLKSGADISKITERAEALLSQTRRAVRLSDTLLDMARIEAGNLVLTSDSFDIVSLAHQNITDVAAITPGRSLLYEGPEKLSIYADEHRLSEVIRNLLDNAVKYAPDGPITLRLNVIKGPSACVDENGQQVSGSGNLTVSVIDHGAGVQDSELIRLFERQYRASDAVSKGITGSGLGLYISARIAQAHGGNMWAEHTPGGGLTVLFTLPCSLDL